MCKPQYGGLEYRKEGNMISGEEWYNREENR